MPSCVGPPIRNSRTHAQLPGSHSVDPQHVTIRRHKPRQFSAFHRLAVTGFPETKFSAAGRIIVEPSLPKRQLRKCGWNQTCDALNWSPHLLPFLSVNPLPKKKLRARAFPEPGVMCVPDMLRIHFDKPIRLTAAILVSATVSSPVRPKCESISPTMSPFDGTTSSFTGIRPSTLPSVSRTDSRTSSA